MAGKTANTPAKGAGKAAKEASPRKTAPRPQVGEVVLLSGGNPQIAKGHGDAPVQDYIVAMPGRKSDLGRRLDKIIVCAIPGVRKAVKWNSPFYGAGDEDRKREEAGSSVSAASQCT